MVEPLYLGGGVLLRGSTGSMIRTHAGVSTLVDPARVRATVVRVARQWDFWFALGAMSTSRFLTSSCPFYSHCQDRPFLCTNQQAVLSIKAVLDLWQLSSKVC